MTDHTFSRRAFLRTGCATALTLGTLATAKANEAGTRLALDNPTAMALGYTHDASSVDVNKFPKRGGEAGAMQFCDNCSLYQGAADTEWAPCTIFQNQEVAGKGWCNAWVPKA